MLSTLARASLRGERAQQRQQPRLSAAAPRQAAGRVRRGPAPCSASSGPTGGPSDGQDEPSTSGDGEELAAILSAEITAREKLILAVENEKDRLREVVEKEKEQWDALEQAAKDRAELEFGLLIADINNSTAEFEAGLQADRERNKRDMEELAEFEAQAARDLNNNLFFQTLYKPTVTAKKKKKLSPEKQQKLAAAEIGKLRELSQAQSRSPAQYISYFSLAGAIVLFAAIGAGKGWQLTPVQEAILALLLSATVFQIWMEIKGWDEVGRPPKK